MTTPILKADSPVLEPIVVVPGEVLHVFKSRVPFVKYFFTDGRSAEFIKEPDSNNGVFYTNQQDLIDELKWQITKRHPMIFIDPKQPTIKEEERDPSIRKRNAIIADLIQEGWTKTDPNNNMGKSIQGPMNVASTSSAAAVSAGGDGATEINRLSALQSKLASGKKFTPPVGVDFVPPTKEELESNQQPLGAISGLDERNITALPLPPDAAATSSV